VNIQLDDEQAQEIYDRFRALRHHMERTNLRSVTHDLLLTETVITALGLARTQVVIDKDLQQLVHAGKNLREFALQRAVQWGLLTQREWTTKARNTVPAWELPR
jgi:Ribonuclease G/E